MVSVRFLKPYKVLNCPVVKSVTLFHCKVLKMLSYIVF